MNAEVEFDAWIAGFLWVCRDAKVSHIIDRYLYVGWNNGIRDYGGNRMKTYAERFHAKNKVSDAVTYNTD